MTASGRLRTAVLLLLAAGVAAGTPAYIAWRSPGLRGYLWHPAVFLMQAAPAVLGGLLWLPWRSDAARRAGRWLSVLLVSATAVCAVVLIASADDLGSDMVALTFVAITLATCAGVVVASMVAGLLVLRLGRRDGREPPQAGR